MEKKKQKKNNGILKMLRPRAVLLVSLAVLAASRLPRASGAGRLNDPPARGSVWRFAKEHGIEAPVNKLDAKVNCGGHTVHYTINKGKCGVCGDVYGFKKKYREHEPGGRFMKGILVKSYPPNQDGNVNKIDVEVSIFDNRRGEFRFDLCIKDDVYEKATHKCFTKLKVSETEDGPFKTKYELPDDLQLGKKKFWLQLPVGVKCKACVLRWRWSTRLNYGCWQPKFGKPRCGMGYGDEQEKFFGCADIIIGYPETVADPLLWKNDTVYDPSNYTKPTPPWFEPPATDISTGFREVEGSVDGYGICSCDCGDGPMNYGYNDTMWSMDDDYYQFKLEELIEDRETFAEKYNMNWNATDYFDYLVDKTP